MAKQNAVDSLRESIRLLEVRQAEEGKILKEQLRITYESLKPVNLIKSTIKDIAGSVEARSGLVETIIAILSGYFTQKMVVRPGSNVLMRILGTVLQFGVASFVAKNVESIRNFMNQQFDKVRHLAPEEEIGEPQTGA
jgi:hypothetical protein